MQVRLLLRQRSRQTRKDQKTKQPSQIDCDKDHQVVSQDDKTLKGTLRVHSCHASRFGRKPSRLSNVGGKFSSLVNDRCKTRGVNDKYQLQFVQTQGGIGYTDFTYTLPCEKARHQIVIDSLKDACKDKDLVDTITEQNQPDDDDSSSESDEAAVTKGTKATQASKSTAAPTQKATAAPTQKATAAPTEKATAAPTTQRRQLPQQHRRRQLLPRRRQLLLQHRSNSCPGTQWYSCPNRHKKATTRPGSYG